MNIKKISFLLVLMAVVYGLLEWDDYQFEKEEKDEAQKNLALKFDSATVSKFTFIDKSLTNPEFTLVRKEGSWHIESPVKAKASDKDIENLLETLSTFKYTKKFPVTQDKWIDYGLKTGIRTIELEFATERKPLKIFVGSNAPVGYSVYLRHSDSSDVFIGSQYLATATGKKLYDFRNKSFTGFNSGKISKFVYRTLGLDPIILEEQEGDFRITAPIQSTIDQFAKNELFRALEEAKATEFIDNPSEEIQSFFVDDKAEFSFSWDTADGSSETLLLTTIKDNFYASFTPSQTVYGVSDEFQSKIAKKLFDLRNKRIFSFDAEEIKSAIINGDYYKFKKEKWINTDSEEHKSLAALLIDLEYINTEKFVNEIDSDIAALLREPHQHEIELMSESKSIVIKLYPYKDDDLYLLKTDEVIGIVKKEIIENGINPKSDSHAHDGHDHAGHDHGDAEIQ